MDQMIVSSERSRRTQQEILDLLSAFQRDNVSVKHFCQLHGISTASFHHWKKKYQGDDVKTGFATLQITGSLALFAEVGSIKLYQPVSAAYLRELLP